MKGLYRKISVVLLLAMLISMFSSVGIYATDDVTNNVGNVVVEETQLEPSPSAQPEPQVTEPAAPEVSAEPETTPVADPTPSVEKQEEANVEPSQEPQENVTEEAKPSETPKEEAKEETFYDQLMKLKTCKEVYNLLTDDLNYDKAMALTVEQVKALREYVQTLTADGYTEILIESIDQLLIALGVDLDEKYGTDLSYVLNMNCYNSNAKVYWAVIDANRNVQDQSYVSSISLNSSAVTYGDPKVSWSGGTALSSYYPGVSAGGNGDTSKTLTITPKTGYYVTRVVVACCGSGGRVSPLSCETWKDSNAYEKAFSVSTQGSISTQLPAKAFAHTSNSSAYFILVSVAPVPTPLYVEYDYGNIKDYLGDAYSTSAFATASGWTTASSANVYKTDASDGGIQTANTQFKYTYATSNTSGAASWKHTTNTLTEQAVADAAKAGYEFAGWAYTYYTSASASQTSGQYNNYKYTFGSVYGSGNIGTGVSLTLVTNVRLVAQWKQVTTTSVKVEKVWDDKENNDNKRPESITVSLYMDGEDTGKDLILNATNSWKGTFTGLAVGHTYTVKEDAVNGYTSNVTGDATNGFVITNTHQVETVAATTTVTKVWNDNNDQDGVRPKSIQVQFYATTKTNGKKPVGDPVELNEGNNWTFKAEGLWKYYKGEEITWTVEEAGVPEGYTSKTTGDAATGFTITNSYTPSKTSVQVTKAWEDGNNQDGKRPTEITVMLLADGVATNKTVTLNATNNWTAAFENLDVKKAGNDIVYTVEEVEVKDYESVVTGTAKDGFTITNIHTPETVANGITVTKIWDDANDQDGKRPDSITVRLYANGSEVDAKTVTGDDNWTYTFTNLPKYANGKAITYTITEDTVEDYTTSIDGYNITNSYTPGKTSVSVTKAWEDDNNRDGKRPESITVKLLADGEDTDKTVVLNEANKWSAQFTELDEKKSGEDIVYTVEEVSVSGYETAITGSAKTGYIIINTHTPQTASVSGTKTWNDDNDRDGVRPESITVNLMANGVQIDSQTVTAENGWKYEFKDLYKFENGEKIEYTVSEEAVEGYEATASSYNLINTHTPDTYEKVTVAKKWNDSDDKDGARPEKIVVELLANGEVAGQLTLSAENNWQGAFENLPVNENGEEITYRIREVAVEGYQCSISGNVENGFTISNTLLTDIVGKKTWNDNNDQDGVRSEKITVHLTLNGHVYRTTTTSAAENWEYTFENVPKYNPTTGELVVYGIAETSVKGYTAEANGYNLVNTHEPEKLEGSISGTKTWNDNDDQDGKRPESITVNLLANGEKVASQTVTAENGWKYEFKNLDKFANGVEIKYTITEETVEGYNAKVNGYDLTNTHEVEKITSISGEKTWSDNNNQDGIRPESITVNLLANGEKIASQTVTAENGWKYEFKNLDKYENGVEIQYTIAEEAVDGYTAKADGYNLTNTHEVEKITSISGEKIWDDKDNQDGIRPENITVNLLANGEKVASQTVTAETGWKYEFKDLDKYENGVEIKYTVEEVGVAGYTSKVDGYNITNTHETETTNVTIEKKWVDNNDKEDKRPGSITVQLYANGEKLGDTVKITAKDGWKYEFKDLDKYQNGKLVEYTVKETSEKYYVAKYASKDGVLTITNTFVDIPLTGDTINLLFWTMMVLGAGAVLGGIGVHFRRRRA